MPTVLLQLEGAVAPASFFDAAVAPLARALRTRFEHAADPDAAAWDAAFRDGALRLNPFRDVVFALRAWSHQGVTVVVLGRPPTAALRTALRYTTHQDLTPLITDVVGGEDPTRSSAWSTLAARWPGAMAVVGSPEVAEAARAGGWRAHVVDRAAGDRLDRLDVAPPA